MASDYGAFGSAIFACIGTAGTAQVYNTRASQGAIPPYVIFQRNAADDQYVFGNRRIVAGVYVVKAVSNRYWTDEAERLYAQYHEFLQGKQLTATGFTFLRCLREASLLFQDAALYWHVGGTYNIEAQET